MFILVMIKLQLLLDQDRHDLILVSNTGSVSPRYILMGLYGMAFLRVMKKHVIIVKH
jgi:hypothetical protein